eukprot:jgi/Psemu1/15714/gm1.15714_g
MALGPTTGSIEGAVEEEPIDNNNNSSDIDIDIDIDSAIRKLSGYHPIVIEGMGYYDPRDPSVVAKNLCRSLKSHLAKHHSSSGDTASESESKPYLVVVQGDPLSERGISAITPLVAECLGLERGLVCLDPHIDPAHSQNADRENVVLEVTYSQLARVLDNTGNDNDNDNNDNNPVLQSLEDSVDALIAQKNHERTQLGKPPMKEYFKQYAMLQEVTKASLRRLCGDRLTIAHTSAEINPFSVTSFYRVGLDLGLYHEATDMVAYRNHDGGDEVLDFDAIDTR